MSTRTSIDSGLTEDVRGQHEKVHATAFSDRSHAYRRTTHPAAQWYAAAGLGLFFHWGISSVSGRGDLSWSMMKRGAGFSRTQAERHGLYAVQTAMPPSAYWRQAEKFLCENYDPDKWLSAAREAGVEYVVLTTRHHDGFSLWPSAFGELNTRTHLQGRDLVGEFVDAARSNGLRIGFYYSPPDWYFCRDYMSFRYGSETPFLDADHRSRAPRNVGPEEKARFDSSYRAYVNGQLGELLTRYGRIDILWFDGSMPEGAMTAADIRRLQPAILMNSRGYGYGDFDTPECCLPGSAPEPGWWEYCHVFSDGAWGYLDHETYKPLGWFLAEFGKARALGGKFLPNVAPNARGEMPDTYYLRLRQLKAWMAHSGESVVGVDLGRSSLSSNVPLTHRGSRVYAHVDWMMEEEPVRIGGLAGAPRAVRLLRTGDEVPHEFLDGVLTFSVPQEWRINLTDVVSVDLCA